MVDGIVITTCPCWSLQEIPGLPWSPLWTPKDAPLFLQHQGLFGLDPLSDITPGPFEDKGLYTALHMQLSRGFKELTDPLCLNQHWNPQLLCWVAISHKQYLRKAT